MGGGTDTSNPQAGSMSSVADYNNMLKSDQQWGMLGSILSKGSSALGKGISAGAQSSTSPSQPMAVSMTPLDVRPSVPPTLIQPGVDTARLQSILRGMFFQ